MLHGTPKTNVKTSKKTSAQEATPRQNTVIILVYKKFESFQTNTQKLKRNFQGSTGAKSQLFERLELATPELFQP